MPRFIMFKPTEEQIIPKDKRTLAALTHAFHLGCVDAHGTYEVFDGPIENDSIVPSEVLLSEAIMEFLWDFDMTHANEGEKPQVMMYWMNFGPKVIANDESYRVIVPIKFVSQHMLQKTDMDFAYLESLPYDLDII